MLQITLEVSKYFQCVPIKMSSVFKGEQRNQGPAEEQKGECSGYKEGKGVHIG